MAGLIDKDAELARLNKEIQRLQGEVARVGGKLSNAAFVDKAPPAVIEKERAKLAESEQAPPTSPSSMRGLQRCNH